MACGGSGVRSGGETNNTSLDDLFASILDASAPTSSSVGQQQRLTSATSFYTPGIRRCDIDDGTTAQQIVSGKGGSYLSGSRRPNETRARSTTRSSDVRSSTTTSRSTRRRSRSRSKSVGTGCISTPGTTTTSTSVSSSIKPAHIAAVVEGNGQAKGEIGLASMDLRYPELCLTQFSDSSGYSRLRVKLQLLNPIEIVVPETAVTAGGVMAALVELLKADFPSAQLTTMPRRYFNDVAGIAVVDRLRVADCSADHKHIAEKYYCLASVAALIKYIEYMQDIVFAPNSVKISYAGVESTCLIDPETARHLELIVSLRGGGTRTEESLYGVMNRCTTHSGARMLRSNLLQPPACVDIANKRLDAIEELLGDETVFHNLKQQLSRMLDIDHLVSLCVHVNKSETLRTAEYKLTQIIYLKHTLEQVHQLTRMLSTLEAELFKVHHNIVSDERFQLVIDKIGSVIDENCALAKRSPLEMRSQKCFAVKSGISGMLDVSRRAYTELLGDVSAVVSEELGDCGYPIKTAFSPRGGFYLELNLRDAGNKQLRLPDCCINQVKQRNKLTFTTRTLIKLNDRISQSVNEIFMMSNEVVTGLLSELREFIGCLYNLTEVVAVLDVVCSLAQFTSFSDSIRPKFGDVLAIRNGRHPLLERLSGNELTPNDTYIGRESSFVLITGPNMAGKSTYLKQVALLQILAQIGCFVPSDQATFRITDQIFGRIGINDDLANQSSAFTVEMKDVAYILKNVTDRSLVIIDELGRSTSTEEGIGICHAICEELIENGCFVLFATHFLDLANLDTLYPNVDNYHFGSHIPESTGEVDGEAATEFRLTHKLARGPYRGPLYGFELAALSTFPEEVITKAKALAHRLRTEREAKVEKSPTAIREKAAFRMGHKVIAATQAFRRNGESTTDNHTTQQFLSYVRALRKQYLEEVQMADELEKQQASNS